MPVAWANLMPISDAVREISQQQRDANLASWQWMILFYESATTNPFLGMANPLHREQCLLLLRLVRQIADSPDAVEFRAGCGGFDLWISTKSENGLRTNDPHIRVAAGHEMSMLSVEYWRGIKAGALVESHNVSENQLLNTIKPLLVRLRSVAQTPQN